MANITIKINTSGDVFEDDSAAEVAAILRLLADTIATDGVEGTSGPLYDSEGEFCGEIDIQEEA